MKHLLILFLDHGELVDSVFRNLSENKFNATVFEARSIKHLLEDEESDDIHFLNINQINKNSYDKSTFCYFLVEEEKLEILKNLIREQTDNFKKIKGGMLSYPIPNYEGTIL